MTIFVKLTRKETLWICCNIGEACHFLFAGSVARKPESKESVVSGARALTLLCHWGNCKTKEDSIMHRRIPPHIKVRLKVCCAQAPTDCIIHPHWACSGQAHAVQYFWHLQAAQACILYRWVS